MALIWGNGGLVRFYVRDPEKAHPWGNGLFWRILRQKPSRALGCSELQEPHKKRTKKLIRFWCAKSSMRGDETPGRIVTNFCRGVGIHDVITCADFYYDRLRGFGVAGGQILAFSIDLLRRSYNTLALPCECVMTRSHPRMCLLWVSITTPNFKKFNPQNPKEVVV